MDQSLTVSYLGSRGSGEKGKQPALLTEASEKYIICNLYRFCQETLEEILSKLDGNDAMSGEWQVVREDLKIWEAELSVMDGKLDQMLLGLKVEDLRELTCFSLCIIAVYSSWWINPIEPPCSYKDILGSGGIVETIIASVPGTKGFLEFTFQGLRERGSELVGSALSGIDNLNDLLWPTKRKYLQYYGQPPGVLSRAPPSTLLNQSERIQSVKTYDTSEAAQPTKLGVRIFEDLICKKFPGISADLAVHFSELNWNRRVRILNMKREDLDSCSSADLLNLGLAGSVSGGEKIPILDPGNPDPLYSGSQILATPELPSTVCPSTSRKLNFPKLAAETLSAQSALTCPICGKQLGGLESVEMWKKHVFEDLQPYSCLFSGCPEANTTSGSKHCWISHEFQHHRPQKATIFVCREPCNQRFAERSDMVHHIVYGHLAGAFLGSEVGGLVDACKTEVQLEKSICPFCQDEIEETKASIQSHVGDHLDEIALQVLQLDVNALSMIFERSITILNRDATGACQ
ncbi:unnamed protein product [Tuber aestivum]|uniref:C2H2-type domain-containing protein n=1 Tax=Tuber aestivum TaxID=59557 RepID=A0A292PZI4_9PEZI|nr:unnamed protein product [Tuber aestivum]